MQIIDTHVHVWTHNGAFPWASKSIDLPLYDAHPESLLDLMARNGVGWAVLVQYIGYGWNNRYVLHVQKSFPSKFMAVCRVNPDDRRAPDQLSYWTEAHGFRGVRLSPDPVTYGDWFNLPLMVPLFRCANELNVPVLILTKPSRLPDLASILDRVPETKVVLDHMADCIRGTAEDLDQLLSLAKYPQVYLKAGHISLDHSQDHPKYDNRGFLKQVYETYGASRIMWGSDWPLCLSHMTYPQVIAYARDEMDFLTGEDLEWIYMKTALQLWPFTDAQMISNQDVSPLQDPIE
jgi:L-fuconolactonase